MELTPALRRPMHLGRLGATAKAKGFKTEAGSMPCLDSF